MADPELTPCPHCGSADVKGFKDGSGACNACGRAVRGAGPMGTILAGEEVSTRKKVLARVKNRLGFAGLVGGILGFLTVPLVFVIGAFLAGEPVSHYTSDVFNRPAGAVACAGIVFVVAFAYYTLWSGYLVWRGYPERGIHLLAAGALLAVASLLAGQGVPSVVGVVGGLVALVAGLLVWRSHRIAVEKEKQTASGTA